MEMSVSVFLQNFLMREYSTQFVLVIFVCKRDCQCTLDIGRISSLTYFIYYCAKNVRFTLGLISHANKWNTIRIFRI